MKEGSRSNHFNIHHSLFVIHYFSFKFSTVISSSGIRITEHNEKTRGKGLDQSSNKGICEVDGLLLNGMGSGIGFQPY